MPLCGWFIALVVAVTTDNYEVLRKYLVQSKDFFTVAGRTYCREGQIIGASEKKNASYKCSMIL